MPRSTPDDVWVSGLLPTSWPLARTLLARAEAEDTVTPEQPLHNNANAKHGRVYCKVILQKIT